jgi:hypothetical protein
MIKRPFHVDAGDIKEFEIILSPDTFRNTDTVEVTAGPFETVRQDSPSTLVLAGNDAKNLASVLADDPLRAVQSLPGVTSNDDFEARFSLRGADYSRIGVYMDGILLHMPFHTVEGTTGTGSVTAFNGDMLEALELNPGAYPVRFQDRTAAALDVHTRDGSRSLTTIRGTFCPTNAGFIGEGPLGKGRRGSWLAGARKGFIQYLLNRIGADDSIAFGLSDLQGRISYDLTPRHSVSLNVLESYSDLDRSRAINKLGINSIIAGGYHFTFGNAAWRYAATDTLLVTNRAAWMREKYENSNKTGMPLGGEHYAEWVWDATASWLWKGGNPLDLGWSVRRIHESGYANQFLSAAPWVRLQDQSDGSAVRLGGYEQQSWTFASGHVRLTAGARWDRHPFGIETVSPQASAGFVFDTSTRLQIGWGEYAQSPELTQSTSILGGRNLLPMRSIQANAALERRFGERTRVRLEFYERNDRDLLFRSFYEPRILNGKIFSPPANPRWRNSLRGYARGLGITLERRSANRLTGWISYAFGRTRQREGVEHVVSPSDWDQKHTVNVFGSYRVTPTVNLSVKWAYGSGFPIPGFLRFDNGLYYLASARNQVRLEPYKRLDWRLNKSWMKDRYKITLYVEVVNLTDRRNERLDSFNGYNGRTAQAYVNLARMFRILPSAGVVFER